MSMSAPSIKKGICDALSNVDVSGSFSCFNVLDSFANPALIIPSIGTIGLPLSTRDAKAIANSSVTKQSPFGKGSETLIDTSVRKSWQIDPTDFRLRNPKHDDQVGSIVENVSKELNVACGPANVAAQLYKLLLYEKGAFFLPHQDGEKVKGMFGTLMVCLPSQHAGGEIHLSHEGRRQTISTAETSEFEYSYAAWYSDVTHEIKPVTEGYRLVLIYNLVQQSSGPLTTASASTDSANRLKNVFSHWNAGCSQEKIDVPRMLAYKLSYKYSPSSLSCKSLKGSDHVKFQHLNDACKDGDFLIYLAHIKKEVMGGCDEIDYWDRHGGGGYDSYEEDSDEEEDGEEGEENEELHAYRKNPPRKEIKDLNGCHEIIEEIDSSIQLTRVIDQNSREVAKNVDFEIEDIAQGNIFKRAPDEEDYTGYTGNEGVSTTHFYHDTVALFFPRTCRVDFEYKVSKSDPDRILHWIKRLEDDLSSSSNESTRLDLKRLCELAIEQQIKTSSSTFSYSSTDIYSDEMTAPLVSAALSLDDVLLLESALNVSRRRPDLEIFNMFRQAIPRLGFDALQPALEKAFQLMKSIYSKWSAMLRVAGEPSIDSDQVPLTQTQVVEDWLRGQVSSVLSPYSELTSTDGTALADMADRFGVLMLERHIAPYVKESSDKTTFAVAFLTRLFELRGRRIPASAVSDVYTVIIDEVFTQLDYGDSEQRVAYLGCARTDTMERRSQEISATQWLQILQHCETFSLDLAVGRLFRHMEGSALKARTDSLETVLIPYLVRLLAHLQNRASVAILGNDCREHVHMILLAYIIRCVDPEPRRPANWSRSAEIVRCVCQDCRQFNTFVKDDARPIYQFRTLQARRKHLEKHLPSTGYQCHTITSGSPHTLIITKVHGEYQKQHSQWLSQFRRVKGSLDNLDSNPWLKSLLGDKHDEIANLRITDRPLPALRPNPVTTMSSSVQQRPGKKRKGSEHKHDEMADQAKRTKLMA
jgi:2OG-Fe(II) oxygenase superfamily